MHYSHFPAVGGARKLHSWLFSDTSGGAGNFRDGDPSSGHDPLARALYGKRILVVEDEAVVAFEIDLDLTDRGAEVVGPVGTLEETIDAIHAHNDIAAAILDVRISGQDVYPAAKILAQRDVPFLFHTGHARRDEVAALFPEAEVCLKPKRMPDLLLKLAELITLK